jgi:hypothetical protein
MMKIQHRTALQITFVTFLWAAVHVRLFAEPALEQARLCGFWLQPQITRGAHI